MASNDVLVKVRYVPIYSTTGLEKPCGIVRVKTYQRN